VIRQLLRYGVVGCSSSALYIAAFWFLMQWGPSAQTGRGSSTGGSSYAFLANTAAFCLTIMHSFIWNRRWTFEGSHRHGMAAQFILFLAISLGGLAISSVVLVSAAALRKHWGLAEAAAYRAGQPLAVPAVAVWNFAANRRWTFAVRSRAPEGEF
jgi:putative flippase GtrA